MTHAIQIDDLAPLHDDRDHRADVAADRDAVIHFDRLCARIDAHHESVMEVLKAYSQDSLTFSQITQLMVDANAMRGIAHTFAHHHLP